MSVNQCNCSICKRRHHSLLHSDEESSSALLNSELLASSSSRPSSEAVIQLNSNGVIFKKNDWKKILLPVTLAPKDPLGPEINRDPFTFFCDFWYLTAIRAKRFLLAVGIGRQIEWREIQIQIIIDRLVFVHCFVSFSSSISNKV